MTLTMRHIAGLVFAVVLTLLLYWIWQDGLTMVQRMLRMSPNLRALWGEFSTLIAFFLVCFVLTLAQILWDKLPSHDPH